MSLQRILEVERDGSRSRLEVGSAIEMFSVLLDPEVTCVEMLWDSSLGDKRMTFKKSRDRSHGDWSGRSRQPPSPEGLESRTASYYDIRRKG